MKLSDRIKIVLAAIAVILVTVTVLLVPTFALFSDSVNTEHYIDSGTLKIDLYQTVMTGIRITEDGTFGAYSDTEEIDLSAFEGKVFELYDAVPGITRTGTFEVRDAGSSTAYDLSVSLTNVEMSAGGEALLEQIRITVQAQNPGDAAVEESFALSAADETGSISLGTMLLTQELKQFTIKAEFINSDDNNEAQNPSVSFDILVTAVQVTP